MQGVYIPQIDAKDLWISNFANSSEYSLNRKDGELNINKFKASFDYSLDLIKLREVYESVYRNKRFSTVVDEKEYCYRIVNVTFEYSVKAFNRCGHNVFCKLGFDERNLEFCNSVCIVGGELVGIEVDKPVENPISQELLGKYFTYKDGCYRNTNQIKTIKNVSDVRRDIYENGFVCNGIKFVRWKRSAGSARVGRCMFIDENLYSKIHKWESCGLDIKVGDSVDLAGFESYISLTSSSIIDTIEIQPENILIIDDYESVFEDDVICVTESGGVLGAEHKQTKVTNSIFDGQALIDRSLMGKYADKGMILLRSRFFKSCAFNSNIQQFFEDNGITSVEQLKGFTLAKDIKDVKFITTPSSIKFVKFGTLEQWFERLETTFGVVKYEKPTHFFDGRLVQAHYQLINSIQLTREEVDELLKPTFDFMTKIKTDPAILMYWIKFNIDELEEITPLQSKTDVIYKLMSINKDFTKTKLYYDFRADFLKSFTKSLKCGHILINGNYSTLCGNPIEMLKSSIGTFDGTSIIEKGTVYSKRFDFDKKLLGSRSPHITFSNVLVTTNKRYEEIEKYMNPTKEIIYINSVNENNLEKLAGCDFDSDSILITDNEVLIKGALKNDKRFSVAVCKVGGNKIQRHYDHKDLTDLDIKTSKNLIGEIINVSQELNTKVWDLLNDGKSVEEVQDIYLDICKLSIMSNIEIDKAKREYAVDNERELKEIRKKYKIVLDDGRQVKPNFFAHIAKQKGYYDPKKKAYLKHNTSMDYLQASVNSFRAKRNTAKRNTFVGFSEMLNMDKVCPNEQANYRQINDLFDFIDSIDERISGVYANKTMSLETQNIIAYGYRQDCIEKIGKLNISPATMITMLKILDKPEHLKHKRLVFYTLFGYPNTAFHEVLVLSKEPLEVIKADKDGDIDIYGTKFSRHTRERKMV